MEFHPKKPKKEELFESVRDRLERLKAEEPKPKPKIEYYHYESKRESIATNIPERNVEIILKRIDEIERKMNLGEGNYLGFFYDLKALEEQFINELDSIKRNNLDISEALWKKIKQRKDQIDNKLNR